MTNGFTGVLYPVNPNSPSVLSIKTFPSIKDVPGDVDMAVIAVPASMVNTVAEECGQKGVRVLVVISDGFREQGPEGSKLESDLRSVVLSHGMRLVGPNCMSVVNTDADVNLNASFSTIYPPPGNVAFLSQSGALGISILDYPDREGYVYGDKRITFSEYNSRVNRLIHALKRSDIMKGETVGILSLNCSQFCDINGAVMKGGYIGSPFNTRLTANELEYIIS